MELNCEEDIRQVFLTESQAIKNIPVTGQYAEAVELIFDHVHIRKGKLVTSGLGKAGEIAHSISTLFSSTGTPAIFLHPSEAQHGDLGVLQENDVLTLFVILRYLLLHFCLRFLNNHQIHYLKVKNLISFDHFF